MAKQPTSEIATVESSFALVANDVNVAEILDMNMGGNTFNLNDLDAVRIPAGGGIAWTVPGIDGEEVQKAVSGVIIAVQSVRAWWLRDLNEPGAGNAPPDCSSPDARTGFGDPLQLHNGMPYYQDCKSCPNSEYGSSPRGAGQWCKEMRQVFVVRETDALPVRFVLPPTSLKEFNRYLLRLSNNARPYFSVVTRFTLERTANPAGISYSKASFERERDLSERELPIFRAYSQSFRTMVQDNKPTITSANDYVYQENLPSQ